jgi:hypothetical protein
MRKKNVISMAVVALLLIGIMATSVLASNLTSANNTAVSKELQATSNAEIPQRAVPAKERSPVVVRPSDESTSVKPDRTQEVDLESLRNAVPETYEKTDARISAQRVRFLLYTHEGKHIMWGFVGNGHFVGTDNLGKRCWGIYGNGVFAGFYGGEFLWGKYRGGNWKAEGLFGLNCSHGKYILFPAPTTAARP